MKTSVVNLSCKKLVTVIALSLVSLFALSQSSLASQWLNIVKAKLEREGRIIVKGHPLLDTIYWIEGMDYVFAGEGCKINPLCRTISGGMIYDQELNYALASACSNQNNYSVICIRLTH